MLKSMTGYGRSEVEVEDGMFTVEIKTLNSRFRDIILRMPQDLSEIEMDIRKWISNRLNRGRIEVYIRFEPNPEKAEYELFFNESLAKAYMEIFQKISSLFSVSDSISLDTFCHLRDVIVQRPKEKDIEKVKSAIKSAIDKALFLVEEMRKREGELLQEDILSRLDSINKMLKKIKERVPAVVEYYRDRLMQSVSALLQGQDIELDESRLVQEVAFFAERSDITEEIVRLESHLSQFLSFIKRDEPVGRRLDFLVQEMNREANTIGAKCQDVEISKLVVDIKAEIEKIREQVQNIE